ncbi:PREDICTED: fibroblast growth factor receptor substrate 2-like [Nicrophorus vespilloides]|uniref:Fibroblast growth factor receptor substrate 2-like n=1 Tax=Nicrophorus vespilloides TaxID=110193 RepID=A0ABM1M3W8_NICVS|nr:PREDICTED: fibroblast growth factor receptor substrate 2-like [Nicrophorus vespilloides]
MGCVNSKDINDAHPNMFQVVNLDATYHAMSAGRLELTDTELILHQRGKAPTKWPLRCLRKYGFDSQIFTFECGRRSATGPGIYAFRCRKAERLFNMLQHYIQDRNLNDDFNFGDLLPQVQRRPPPEGYLNPTIRPTLSRPGSMNSNGPISPISVTTLEHNNNKRNSIEHAYLNTMAMEDNIASYINLDAEMQEPTTSLYVNINADNKQNPESEDHKHNYANVDEMKPLDTPVPTTPTSIYLTVKEVNYIELDLGKNEPKPPKPQPDCVPKSSKSYVVIDFDRTNALSHSTNPHIEIEEGSRKTRHNSTICDTIGHRNSISD